MNGILIQAEARNKIIIPKFALSFTQEFSLAILAISVYTDIFKNNLFFQSKLSKVFFMFLVV